MQVAAHLLLRILLRRQAIQMQVAAHLLLRILLRRQAIQMQVAAHLLLRILPHHLNVAPGQSLKPHLRQSWLQGPRFRQLRPKVLLVLQTLGS